MELAYIATPIGTAEIKGNEAGISSIIILDSEQESTVNIPKVLKLAATQLQAYFSGNRQDFDLQLNPSGTEFQRKVWQSIVEIPFGKSISYLELSKKLGDVKAIRAVASANGKNPLWIVVPCHRVIGTDGSLTGYAGGLWRKKWLLEHESPSQQQLLF